MPYALRSRARVATARPDRYAKQLATHLGRTISPEDVSGGHRLFFAAERGGDTIGGEGLVIVPSEEAAHLELTAEADTAEMLARIQDVMGRHLEKFGQKDALIVTWQPPTAN